jgi:hypothetical protein
MYANAGSDASFAGDLLGIDRRLLAAAKARGCRCCGGPLHAAHYPRKPRGIADSLALFFAMRFGLCCGHCRRRCTPPSVRFLGRRVYVGAVVVLATIRALCVEIPRRTTVRWSDWWTQVVPHLTLWAALKASAPAVDESRLPASLLERFEAKAGGPSATALVNLLRALAPVTTGSCALDEGAGSASAVTHKTRFDLNLRDRLPGGWR